MKVSEPQKNYVSDSYAMLARAYAYREQRSRAFVIYDDETPVGMGSLIFLSLLTLDICRCIIA